jgi:uncharacterized protein
MSQSMYTNSVPVFIHALKNLSAILDKGAAFAASRNIDPSVLVNSRLAPDMFPLSRQIQIVSDTVKGAGARLASVENPRYEDNEATFEELQARITKTITFLETLTRAQIDGTEEKQIKLQAGPTEYEFKGLQYLNHWVFPNLYFHAVTAYNILRHNGVELGKRDFLAGGSSL